MGRSDRILTRMKQVENFNKKYEIDTAKIYEYLESSGYSIYEDKDTERYNHIRKFQKLSEIRFPKIKIMSTVYTSVNYNNIILSEDVKCKYNEENAEDDFRRSIYEWRFSRESKNGPKTIHLIRDFCLMLKSRESKIELANLFLFFLQSYSKKNFTELNHISMAPSSMFLDRTKVTMDGTKSNSIVSLKFPISFGLDLFRVEAFISDAFKLNGRRKKYQIDYRLGDVENLGLGELYDKLEYDWKHIEERKLVNH